MLPQFRLPWTDGITHLLEVHINVYFKALDIHFFFPSFSLSFSSSPYPNASNGPAMFATSTSPHPDIGGLTVATCLRLHYGLRTNSPRPYYDSHRRRRGTNYFGGIQQQCAYPPSIASTGTFDGMDVGASDECILCEWVEHSATWVILGLLDRDECYHTSS